MTCVATERYAPLTDDPVRAVAELGGQRFLKITAAEDVATGDPPDRLR